MVFATPKQRIEIAFMSRPFKVQFSAFVGQRTMERKPANGATLSQQREPVEILASIS